VRREGAPVMARASLFSTALALLLTTCATTERPAFYNPTTGATAQCQASDLDPFFDRCVSTYERAGWVSLSQPTINREAPPTVTSP
jgi:hypothetical protein